MSQDALNPSPHKWSKAACFLGIGIIAIGALIAANWLLRWMFAGTIGESLAGFLLGILVGIRLMEVNGRLARNTSRPEGHWILRKAEFLILGMIFWITAGVPPIDPNSTRLLPDSLLAAVAILLMLMGFMTIIVIDRRLGRSRWKQSD